MINIIEKQFDKLAQRIRERSRALVRGLRAYFKRLLFQSFKFIAYTGNRFYNIEE